MALPPKDQLKIGFAHGAYRMAERFQLRNTGIAHFQVRAAEDLARQLPEADVLVVSMMWKNELADIARRLKFIQSISAGTDQYDKRLLRDRGVRVASAAGVNAQAVAEHSMAMILALSRRLPEARDNQHARHWRGMIGEIARREFELAGRTLLVVGMGRIGSRLVRLAKAFDMRVIATKRDPSTGAEGADAVAGTDRLREVLGEADIVALTCPLTPQTQNLIDATALAAMKPRRTPRQRRARARGERAGADPGAAGGPPGRRRARRDVRGAAAGVLAAVGDAQRADHAPYRR